MNRFVQPSKAVIDGQKSAAALEAASLEMAPDLVPALETMFAPWVEENESLPAEEGFRQVLLGRWLRQVRQRLIAADEAHQKEIRVERVMRRRRDTAATSIEAKVREIRTTFEKVYGAGLTADVIGLASDIPEDPVVLNRYTGRIIAVMSDANLVLPAPRVQGSSMGPEAVIREITPDHDILEEVLEALEPQKRRSQRALRAKQDALAAFRFAVGRISRYLEALCFLAGEDFHAERVRQSSHVRVLEDETFEVEEGNSEPEPEVEPEAPPPDGTEGGEPASNETSVVS